MQAGVVGNLDTNRTQMSALVTSSQSATGGLAATQAGNQLLALQAQQLADLTAAVAAQGRAQNLQAAQQAAAQDQGREQLRRFLNPGSRLSINHRDRCFIHERAQQNRSTVNGRRRRGDGSGRRGLRHQAAR